MLVDSNILIYAAQPAHAQLRRFIADIAGYFSSSMLEVAGEALETMSGSIRVVCNSELDTRDVETAKAAAYALRRAWCASQPERFNSPQAQDRFARLYAFLRSGKMQIKVLPCLGPPQRTGAWQ